MGAHMWVTELALDLVRSITQAVVFVTIGRILI